MAETKTRTRKASGTPSTATAAGRRKAAEGDAAKAEKEKKASKAAEAKKAAAEAREKAKAEKNQAAEKARQEALQSGDLIEVSDNGEVSIEFNVTEPKKDQVAQRAHEVIEELKERGREVPVSGKELADKYGGGTVQWVAFFGMLRVLGLVRAYRFKTGERGKSGMAYLWIGD